MKTLLITAGLLSMCGMAWAQEKTDSEFSTTVRSTKKDSIMEISSFKEDTKLAVRTEKRAKRKIAEEESVPVVISKPDARAVRKSEMIKKYGYSKGLLISQGKIWKGMTIKMALESRGIPVYISRSVGNWGVNERWIYANAYLFFENGVLTDFNENTATGK